MNSVLKYGYGLLVFLLLFGASTTRAQTTDEKTPGEYLVVAGSFSQEMQAINYFNKLTISGYKVFFYEDSENGLYYVHLGKYLFKEDAQAALHKPETKHLTLWIKTLPSL